MTELSRAARELIGQARPAELADAAAKQRVRAAVAVQLAMPPVPPPPAAPAAVSTIAAGGTATKLVLICSLTAAGVIGTAAVVKHRHASQRSPAPQRLAHVARPSSQPVPRPSRKVAEAREVTPLLGRAPSRAAPALAAKARAVGRAGPPKLVVAPERAPEPSPPPEPETIGRPVPADMPLPHPAPAVQPTFVPSAPIPYREEWSAPSSPQPEGQGAGVPLARSREPVVQVGPRANARQAQAGCSSRSELAFLASAQAALRDGQGERALALLNQHETFCPSATFWEERSAARVLALCLLHRERQARSEATLLATHAPRSPQLARLRTSCAAAVIPSTSPQDGR
jgi:hypothetical protein